MHYIGKEQMHTYCYPLFSIFLSKFYLKYKFYQNVKKQRKKEVFLQMLYISFHHKCFYDESAFLCKKNKKVFFKLRREYLIGDKDYKS